jgi:hypothetical protein
MKTERKPRKSEAAFAEQISEAEVAIPARKAWVPKTPVDVVMTQITKQEKRVADLQSELDQEKVLLTKLAKAKAVLEA